MEREQAPLARIVSDFAASKLALCGLALLALHELVTGGASGHGVVQAILEVGPQIER